jgi:hypothetical protein
MQRPMKLRCTISVSEETPSMYRIVATHFDGTPITFKTSPHNVELSQPITATNPIVFGSTHVMQEGKQGSLAKITLPSPSIEYGKNINVNENQLTPLGATIANFK